MSPETPFVRVTWVCPFCDERRSHLHRPIDYLRGRTALLNHIRHTDDADHGGWRDVPDDLTESDLDACLTIDPVEFE